MRNTALLLSFSMSMACHQVIIVTSDADANGDSSADQLTGTSNEDPTDGVAIDYCALSNEEQKKIIYHDPDCPSDPEGDWPWIKDCDGECHLLVFLGGFCDEEGAEDPSANFNCKQFNYDCGTCEVPSGDECPPPNCGEMGCQKSEPGSSCTHPDFPEFGEVGIVGCDGTCYLHWGSSWEAGNFNGASWCDKWCDNGTNAIWNFECATFYNDGGACNGSPTPQAW